jgi:chaperone modulatory protein CbpM
MSDKPVKLNLSDICLAVELPEQVLLELVSHDIIQPQGERPSEWRFDVTMVTVVKRAVRLHRDLDLDWTAVAVIEELLEQREQLLAENAALRRRLHRFLEH